MDSRVYIPIKCMSAFVHTESYKHLMAKQVLKGWLEECDDSFHQKIKNIHFRSNRKCGVWLEYPFASVKNDTKLTIGSETFEVIAGSSWETNWDELVCRPDGHFNEEFVPTFEQCKQIGANVIAVIDVVCAHKGCPSYAIEVCHKNPVSKEKLEKIKNSGFRGELYEIDAEWILCQTRRPDNLNWKLLYKPDSPSVSLYETIPHIRSNIRVGPKICGGHISRETYDNFRLKCKGRCEMCNDTRICYKFMDEDHEYVYVSCEFCYSGNDWSNDMFVVITK